MAEKQFVKHLYVDTPHPKTPDFVKMKMAVKKDDFIKWLEEQDGEYVRWDVKESKGGKFYAELDTYQADQKKSTPPEEMDLNVPF